MNNKIEQLAYKKWEEAGRPEGQSERFWLEAEKELNIDLFQEIRRLGNRIVKSRPKLPEPSIFIKGQVYENGVRVKDGVEKAVDSLYNKASSVVGKLKKILG